MPRRQQVRPIKRRHRDSRDALRQPDALRSRRSKGARDRSEGNSLGLPSPLAEAWATLGTGGSLDAVHRQLGPLADLALTREELAFGNYVVRIGPRAPLVHYRAVLAQTANLGLRIAPQVVAQRDELQDGRDRQGLVMRYAAIPGERLRRVEPSDAISAEAAARFRADLETLYRKHLHHLAAHRGLKDWLVSSDTGTLVLAAWEQLVPVADKDVRAELAAVDRLLGSLSRS